MFAADGGRTEIYMQDRIIVEKLLERSEEGLTLLDRRYRGLSFSVMTGILENAADREECYNDLLMAIWNSIPPHRPRSLEAYVCTLVRRIAINRYRYNTRAKRSTAYTVMLSELEEAIPDVEDDEESDGRIAALLSDFIASLDPETRVLFVRRYVQCESVESLAERFHMGENAVASRLYRARTKLKKLLRKENVRI